MTIAGLFGLSICAQAWANHPRSEEQATDTGRQLVESATHGGLAQAFDLANGLRRADDPAFASSLDHQRQTLTAELGTLGAAGKVQLTGEQHFGGCITREFRVRYAAGDVRWILKFRQGVTGFYLYDLAVTGLNG